METFQQIDAIDNIKVESDEETTYEIQLFYEQIIQLDSSKDEVDFEEALKAPCYDRMSSLSLGDLGHRGMSGNFERITIDIETFNPEMLSKIVKEHRPHLKDFKLLMFQDHPISGQDSFKKILENLKLLDKIEEFPVIEVNVVQQSEEEEYGFTAMIDSYNTLQSRQSARAEKFKLHREAILKVKQGDYHYPVLFNKAKCVLNDLFETQQGFTVNETKTNMTLLQQTHEQANLIEVDEKNMTIDGVIQFLVKEDFEEFMFRRQDMIEDRYFEEQKGKGLRTNVTDHFQLIEAYEQIDEQVVSDFEYVYSVTIQSSNSLFQGGGSHPGFVVLKMTEEEQWQIQILDETKETLKFVYPLTQIYQFVVGSETNAQSLIIVVKKRILHHKMIFPLGIKSFLGRINSITSQNVKFEYSNLLVIPKEQFELQRQFQLEARRYDWLDTSQGSKNVRINNMLKNINMLQKIASTELPKESSTADQELLASKLVKNQSLQIESSSEIDKFVIEDKVTWTQSLTGRETELRVMLMIEKVQERAVIKINQQFNQLAQFTIFVNDKEFIKLERENIAEVYQNQLDNRIVSLIFDKGQLYSLVFSNVFIKHLFMQLLEFKCQTESKLRLSLLTWNQARILQTAWGQKPESLLRNMAELDIVVVASQECERTQKANRIGEIEKFMEKQEFVNIDTTFCGMWEMFIIVFVKRHLRVEVKDIKKQAIAKGKLGFGNKGCVAYSFVLRERVFNFIACHLKHGQDASKKRDKEASELIRELKLQQIPMYKGLECDSYGDFTFFFGDLNYRINSTFEKLNANIKDALDPANEQLSLSIRSGNYPNYFESEKQWLPTYKLSFKQEGVYVNKKDQSPSYTDRILFRNNTCSQVATQSYEALHDVLGSDHRPVVLNLEFQLPRYQFCELNSPKTGYLIIKSLDLLDAKFQSMFKIIERKVSDESKIQIVVQFYASFIDIDAQVVHSHMIEYDQSGLPLSWQSNQLPTLKTPLNALELIKSRTLLMMIWGKIPEQTEFALIGQVVFKLEDMVENDSQSDAVTMALICFGNQTHGVAKIGINYKTI